MSRTAVPTIIGLLLAACWVSAQAQGALVGVAGGWATGYMGFLARNGLPRERLLDTQVGDPQVLRRLRVLIVDGPITGWEQSLSTVEGWVREGGCALLDYSAYPSEQVLPGARIPGQAGPNFLIEAAAHPAVAGIPVGRTYPYQGNPAAAIVPAAGSGAVVLARFTEVGASDKIKGHFVVNGQSVPAILYLALGKGHLIYAGPYLGDVLAFGGDYRDLLLALLRFFSNGTLTPRLTLAGPENLLTKRSWGRAATASPPPGPEAPLPAGFAALDDLRGAFGEYDVLAKTQGEADLLLDCLGPTKYHAVHLRPEGVRISAAVGGAETDLASARVAAPSGAEVIIARRRGSLRVLVDGRVVLEAADRGQWGGVAAAKGLAEASVQPIGRLQFSDDFMRAEGERGEWTPVAGNWQVVSSEGSPEHGANPFSYGVDTTEVALVATGEWYWDDYAAAASARWMQNAAGLAFHYRNAQTYDLLEADLAAQTLRFTRLRAGKAQVLKETPVKLHPWQWYRLGVRSSRGLLVGELDGAPAMELTDSEAGCGPIALYARNARAVFDDVSVADWRVFSGSRAAEAAAWRATGGQWAVSKEGRLSARVGAPALLEAPEQWGDSEAQVEVLLGRAERAGLRFRADEGRAGEAILRRTATGVQLQLSLPGTEALARSLKGFVADAWHRLSVKVVRECVRCSLDGEPVLSAAAAGLPAAGAVSLLAAGAADFRAPDLRPLADDLGLTDPPTPAYAGVVDVVTWATPAGSWLPDPTDLLCFRHEGDLPGDLSLKVGVHRGADARVAGRIALAARDGALGYLARFEHQWGKPGVAVTLERASKEVARASSPGEPPSGGFLIELERRWGALVLRVDGSAVLAYTDAAPLASSRVSVRLEGATLCYDDLVLETPNVRTDTFAAAPADWLIQSGTWEVTSRWTCSPGWTWLSGVAPEYAMAQSKWQVEGDVTVDAYMGAKMVTLPTGAQEALRDLRLGICGRPGFLNSGYFFLIGAKGGAWTALQRNGLVVAETTDFHLPQSSLHNDWRRLGIVRRGATVSLLCEGQPVLSYTDPDPLPGGAVSFGTYHNGVMIPRVTVYGSVSNHRDTETTEKGKA